MSTDLDGVKGAVIYRPCMVDTVLDGTLDAVVFCAEFHVEPPFDLFDSSLVSAKGCKKYEIIL